MNSENNVSLQTVLLTMMLEKIDNLSNRINEMQIASGDIKEACEKVNDRISAYEEKFAQLLQHQSSEPEQLTATPVEADEEKETAMPAIAPSFVKTKVQTVGSKPAGTKSLFEDKPFSLASSQPAAPSPAQTQAQPVGSKPAGTKSIFGNNSFSFAPQHQPAVATCLFGTLPKESLFDAKPAIDVSNSLFGGTGSSNTTPLSFASGTSFLDKKTADAPNDVFGARTSSTFAKQNATEENENPEEYVPDAHYEPVIPLPDKVDVVTGEESEQVVFKNRCKLYIFNSETKEVKERGVGDLKVLYNPENKNYRAVMRREQVHKICANFRITKGMTIADKAGTKGCGMFSCIDFSENPQNGTSTVFYARFREENVYEEFKKLFNEVAEGNHVSSGISSTNTGK